MKEDKEKINKIVARRLKSLLDYNDIQSKELAVALDIQPSSVTNYTKADRFPDAETLNKICDYFDCSMDYLFGRTNKINDTTTLYEYEDNTIIIDKNLNLKLTDELLTQMKIKIREEVDKTIDEAFNQAFTLDSLKLKK